MKLSFRSLPDHLHRKRPLLLLVFFLLGHLLGVWSSGYASDTLLPAMRAVVSSRVSIIGLLSSLMLPLLFSAFAVYMRQPVLLFPIAFWKAFLFSFLGAGLCTAFGSAGWLMMPLAMFGSLCSVPVLFWYWLRHIEGLRFHWGFFCLVLAALTAVGIIDWYFVEPFLARIISF